MAAERGRVRCGNHAGVNRPQHLHARLPVRHTHRSSSSDSSGARCMWDGFAQEHEDVLRPFLVLKDTLGRCASASEQSNSSATARKKTEAAIQKARMAAVQEAQSEQDQIRQEHSLKEQQL